MQKLEYLKSIPTHVLSSWREKATTSGNGNYTVFDYKTVRSMIFSSNDLDIELRTREDATNRKEFQKKSIKKSHKIA
jgi:hypothetical protein